jgi:N-dimethylarginine dimethylaminohydrolase
MCRPEYFTVSYSINPWMHPKDPTDTARAVAQWQALYDAYLELGHEVQLIDQVDGLPDMVYTANGGVVIGGVAYGPRFAFPERAPEGELFMDWFRTNGFEVAEPLAVNEGEGDFMLAGSTILAGMGFRSSPESHAEASRVFDREVLSLKLVDPRFYHLDTALAVLDPATDAADATIAYFPGAFDEPSRALLAERYPDALHIDEDDASVLGLNSISDGHNVVISPRAVGFEKQLRERGYNPITIDLSELLRGGGGIKCCTLELRR